MVISTASEAAGLLSGRYTARLGRSNGISLAQFPIVLAQRVKGLYWYIALLVTPLVNGCRLPLLCR